MQCTSKEYWWNHRQVMPAFYIIHTVTRMYFCFYLLYFICYASTSLPFLVLYWMLWRVQRPIISLILLLLSVRWSKCGKTELQRLLLWFNSQGSAITAICDSLQSFSLLLTARYIIYTLSCNVWERTGSFDTENTFDVWVLLRILC